MRTGLSDEKVMGKCGKARCRSLPEIAGKTTCMFFRYLSLQKTILYSLIIFFANRAWNYYDRLTGAGPVGQGFSGDARMLLLTAVLFSFFLGFAVCLECGGRNSRKD